MIVYGVALLALCTVTGVYLGELLGALLGVQANVGGVGIAMVLLILLSDRLRRRGLLPAPTEAGIGFWSAMYIPIVVAMSAKQNVFAALSSGWLALIAGIGAVAASFALVPLLARLGRRS